MNKVSPDFLPDNFNTEEIVRSYNERKQKIIAARKAGDSQTALNLQKELNAFLTEVTANSPRFNLSSLDQSFEEEADELNYRQNTQNKMN